ncbi:tetraspanin-8-like isoform X2 [Scleropages formosus]|nr:tetraspanin-8-like isoform X2 [Scleropages formosus]XP_018620923.1 tetraspanin-8-like isoform X2 [Scleropages formosus]
MGHVVQNSDYAPVEKRVEGLIFAYILGILSMGVSCLGIYGAYKEKKWALIVFLVMMSLGYVGLLWVTVSLVIALPKTNKAKEEEFRHFLPLNEASLHVKQLVDQLQVKFNCCGLFNGYKDWGRNIPHSCLCPYYYQQTDKCEAAGQSLLSSFMGQGFNSTKMVYKQSCFPVLKKLMLLGASFVLGISFGFAAMMLLGLVMCSVILYQTGQR